MDNFYQVLGQRNWVFRESLPVEEIGGLVDSASDRADAERKLIGYYKDVENLRFHALRLRRFEAMRQRLHLIERAQEDYLAGRYYACTLILLTVMDGFVNDVDKATRQGLHAREPEDFDVYDSVIAHHYGLAYAHQSFRQSQKSTDTAPVYELHRNGILHGMLTNYDNDVVATKAWNRMFAVADWATARHPRAGRPGIGGPRVRSGRPPSRLGPRRRSRTPRLDRAVRRLDRPVRTPLQYLDRPRNLRGGRREDLSEAQTADLLGCTVGTVKSQASRGLRKLAEVLSGDGTPTTGGTR